MPSMRKASKTQAEEASYTVGSLAKLAGVTVRALHHYEDEGLLHPERTASGYRRYGAADVERLQQIPKLLHYSVRFLLKSLSDLVRFIYRFPLYQAHGMKNGKSRSILISIQNAHTNARTPSKRRRSIYCYGAGDGTRTREMKAWEAFALPLGDARVGEHYTPSAPISLVY